MYLVLFGCFAVSALSLCPLSLLSFGGIVWLPCDFIQIALLARR
jgi:hypothetical protein